MPYQKRKGSQIPNPRDLVEGNPYLFNRARRAPLEILEAQQSVEVPFYGFDGMSHTGLFIVHWQLAVSIRRIFAELHREQFPIGSIKPIAIFGWDDERSMRANNSSGFNYRFIAGTGKLSQHAYGRAVDVNPWLNPQVIGGIPYPRGAAYDPRRPGTITADSLIITLFRQEGFVWGGEWRNPDYQHFEKP